MIRGANGVAEGFAPVSHQNNAADVMNVHLARARVVPVGADGRCAHWQGRPRFEDVP